MPKLVIKRRGKGRRGLEAMFPLAIDAGTEGDTIKLLEEPRDVTVRFSTTTPEGDGTYDGTIEVHDGDLDTVSLDDCWILFVTSTP